MKKKLIFILIMIILILQYFCFFTKTFAVNQTISQDIENLDSNTYPQIKEMIQNLKNEHPNWNFKILYIILLVISSVTQSGSKYVNSSSVK